MPTVAVLGERARVQGFALAGATTMIAEDVTQVLAAWHSLGDDVAVVVLTPRAAAVLSDELHHAPAGQIPLPVVIPEVVQV